MTRLQRRFTRLYWSIVIIGLVTFSYINGSNYKNTCHQVEGKVVAQVNLPSYKNVGGKIRSYDHFRPQIAYPVGDAVYHLTAKNRSIENGQTVQVLYEKDSPSQALVYTWTFWLDHNVLVPALVIAAFIFCIIFISITNYGKERIVLPGELDGFVTDRVSGSYTA